jgi:hypothetical protein
MEIKQRNKWIDGFSLRLKTQDEWIDGIKKVPVFARALVARMIWWDFAAERLVKDRWEKFDEFLVPPYDDIPAKALINGLMLCGYSKDRAISRVRRAS